MKRKCSQCGMLKPLNEFSPRYDRKDGYYNYCRMCGIAAHRRLRRRNRQRLTKSACARCGYDKCKAALDYHHKDGTKKSFTVSACSDKSVAAIEAEIAKCVVLCANCHRELTNRGVPC
jgi:hypothetical protein